MPCNVRPERSHIDVEREHARALILLDSENAAKLSQAEVAVSRLQTSIPREREAFLAAHRAAHESRRRALADRWIPKLASVITAWSKLPSRETAGDAMADVAGYIEDGTHSCGSVEPFVLGVAFAESVIQRQPETVGFWSQLSVWTEHNGYAGSPCLLILLEQAFNALQNPLGVGAANVALENLDAKFAALTRSPYVARAADIEAAAARWELFKTGESFHAIKNRFDAPEYRRQQAAAAAAAEANRRRLITRARSGDEAARMELGPAKWAAVKKLDAETYGPLVP